MGVIVSQLNVCNESPHTQKKTKCTNMFVKLTEKYLIPENYMNIYDMNLVLRGIIIQNA